LRDGDILEIDYCVVEAAASGKKILFVDDINDTGATLNWIKDNWLFDPITWGDQIRTAVIHSKVESAFTVNYKTDIISQDIWIVYPWEC
jgi:xanthine phosphoribosyltransferase